MKPKFNIGRDEMLRKEMCFRRVALPRKDAEFLEGAVHVFVVMVEILATFLIL